MRASDLAARALGHPVPEALPGSGSTPIVAASVAGDPPRVRLAWVDAESGAVLARVACPPGRPSRGRPLVAATVSLEGPEANDRVLAARVAPGVRAVRAHLASEREPDPLAVGAEGLALGRIEPEVGVVALDALDGHGEPVGRLVGPGVALLRTGRGQVGGRLGLGHGMAAGIGPGRWVRSLAEAAFEAGYEPWLPGHVPRDLRPGLPRVEPDGAYPFAPPAIVLTWTGRETARVLLRQAPAPLASPDPGGGASREVEVGEARGVLRGRALATLVWETPERAFGLQVRGLPDSPDVALSVARSISAPV